MGNLFRTRPTKQRKYLVIIKLEVPTAGSIEQQLTGFMICMLQSISSDYELLLACMERKQAQQRCRLWGAVLEVSQQDT